MMAQPRQRGLLFGCHHGRESMSHGATHRNESWFVRERRLWFQVAFRVEGTVQRPRRTSARNEDTNDDDDKSPVNKLNCSFQSCSAP